MGLGPTRSVSSRFVFSVALAVALALSLSACARDTSDDGGSEADWGNVETSKLIVASTTSTEDSGLFEELIPAFEAAHPEYEVEVVAVGTGAALEMGRTGDADVLLVHAKASEEEFVEEGYGTARRDVMHNDFVIVGPSGDPAALAGASSANEALTVLAESGSEFVSRGDDSGTHKKELSLWEAADIDPDGEWYVSAGQGMGDCLTMAGERQAYVLADRATFLSMYDNLDLEIAFEGDPALFNQYGVVPVADAANMEGAEAFADWIVGDEAHALIEEFGTEEFGQPLFVPNAM
jgi:tungstate transport system substrate-binding protein